MPAYTLAVAMSRATTILGNRSDIAQSDASFWANAAQEEIWYLTEHALAEKIATSSSTSGENRITKPTDFEELINFSNLSQVPPDVLTRMNVDDVDSASTELGTPINFVEFNDWFELDPSPDSSYSFQIRYKSKPSVLTETTDRTSLATRFGLAWVYKTAELLADHIVDAERSIYFRNKYQSEMVSIPNDLAIRQRSREGMHFRLQRDRR